MDEFWAIILTTWTIEEVDAWSLYAIAVDTGTLPLAWPA